MLCKSKILIGIAGPTAIGKTELSIQLAHRLKNAEIISVDSRQIYRYMDIGTAKPSSEERSQIRHHFIDMKQPDEPYSAGEFGHQVRVVLKELWNRGITPILVGGSGLYWTAVLDGFFDEGEEFSSHRTGVHKHLVGKNLPELYDELGKLDPVAQARVAPRDAPRIIRALEIACIKKENTDFPQTSVTEPLDCLPLLFTLGMERDRLYERIDRRGDDMLTKGFVEEVEGLREMGYGRPCPAMGTLGYAEILDFLDGACSLQEAGALIKKRTRKFAKRQLTWFRRDRRLRWLSINTWKRRGIVERIIAQTQAETDGGTAIFSH